MEKTKKTKLTFILLGAFLATALFFATIFTVICAFRQNDNVLGYYITATILQIVTATLSFFFMFFGDSLFNYWKQWKSYNAKPTIFYPFIATILAGGASLFALMAGFIDSGWSIAPGASAVINTSAYLMEFAFIAGAIPSIIMLPMFFDRNKNIKLKK